MFDCLWRTVWRCSVMLEEKVKLVLEFLKKRVTEFIITTSSMHPQCIDTFLRIGAAFWWNMQRCSMCNWFVMKFWILESCCSTTINTIKPQCHWNKFCIGLYLCAKFCLLSCMGREVSSQEEGEKYRQILANTRTGRTQATHTTHTHPHPTSKCSCISISRKVILRLLATCNYHHICLCILPSGAKIMNTIPLNSNFFKFFKRASAKKD